MPDNIVVKVENVSKDFSYSRRKSVTVKGLFTGILRREEREEKTTQHALQGIDIEIRKGDFFGIVGRNGSGKSTLLKMLAGIYQPTKGKIKVKGKLVPFIELGVGFNPELTGRENVYLNGALLGFSEKEVTGFYDEVVEFAELGEFMDKKLKNYSSGMQVRLAFSMAIRAQADILLIDEVLAVGDADFQRKCFEYFKELKKNKSTVVFVSHDMEAIRRFCSEAVLIEDSKLIKRGDPDMIAHAYIKQFEQDEEDHSEFSEYGKKRWGDGSIKIEEITAKVTEKEVVIQQTIVAQKEIDGCVLGIRIRTTAGEDVTGTNTVLEHQNVPKLKEGKKATVVWKIPNVFSDGVYLVDPAIHHADGITVSDWWQEATRFKVLKSRKLPYKIDPGFEFTVK